MEYVKALNDQFLEPDLLFYVDTPADECMRRISSRNQTVELFEKTEYLKAVKDNYDYIIMGKCFDSLLGDKPLGGTLAGKKSRETIAETVFETAKRILD